MRRIDEMTSQHATIDAGAVDLDVEDVGGGPSQEATRIETNSKRLRRQTAGVFRSD